MTADLASLLASLSRVLPPTCAAGGLAIGEAPAGWPEEEVSMARATAGRRAEFHAGRAAARQAMAALGCAPAAIPRGAGGQPLFPAGLVGSIAHAEGLAVAVAGPAWAVAAVGVDFESDQPLEAELTRLVRRADEALPEAGLAARGIDTGKLVFVTKEAWYKAVYPRLSGAADFLDARLVVDLREDAFRVELANGRRPLGLGGRFFLGGGALGALVFQGFEGAADGRR